MYILRSQVSDFETRVSASRRVSDLPFAAPVVVSLFAILRVIAELFFCSEICPMLNCVSLCGRDNEKLSMAYI